MVRTQFPGRDVNEFIAYAKANPGKLACGHGSSGSLAPAALLAQMAALDVVSVLCKGIPPTLTDLVGGQLQFAFADVGNAVSQMNGGRQRGLGVTTTRRAGKAPAVPAIGDTVKDDAVSTWFVLMAPAGLPSEVFAKLQSTFLAVMVKPDLREKIQGAGSTWTCRTRPSWPGPSTRKPRNGHSGSRPPIFRPSESVRGNSMPRRRDSAFRCCVRLF